MKKLLTLTLILSAALSITACGKKGDVNPPKPQSSLSVE